MADVFFGEEKKHTHTQRANVFLSIFTTFNYGCKSKVNRKQKQKKFEYLLIRKNDDDDDDDDHHYYYDGGKIK